MIELMIVVVIIGILAAMAAPRIFGSIPKMKAKAEARNILNGLRIARGMAISEGQQFGVYVNGSNRQYYVFKDRVNPSLLTFEVGDSIVTGPNVLEGDVVIASSSLVNNCVIFYPTGAASQSASVTVNTYSGSATYTVSILASTGKTKMQ